jgi:hypothetical protein
MFGILFLATNALADIAPSPNCLVGEYSVYLHGNQCVQDDHVLIDVSSFDFSGAEQRRLELDGFLDLEGEIQYVKFHGNAIEVKMEYEARVRAILAEITELKEEAEKEHIKKTEKIEAKNTREKHRAENRQPEMETSTGCSSIPLNQSLTLVLLSLVISFVRRKT